MTTTLRGITWEHARGYTCIVAASEQYERANPDVQLHWEYRSLQAFADGPLDDLTARYDLLVIDHPHIPLAAREGLLAQLDGVGFDDELDELAHQSVGLSHVSYQHDGHQYGLASDAAAQVAVHRPDLIADPPRDWDAVLGLAAEGRVLWPAKPIDAFSSLFTVAANNGTEPMSEPGLFLPEEAMLPALERLHLLAERVPEACLGWNPIQTAEALATDNHYLYAPLLFGYTNYSRVGYRANRLKYTDIPRGASEVAGSLLGGAGIAVSARAAEPTAARRFAFWLASADVQRGIYYDAGGQPGNAVAWDDEGTNRDSLDFFRGTRATLEGARLRPRTPGYIDFQDRTSPWVTDALGGRMRDEVLVRRMNEAAAELLVG